MNTYWNNFECDQMDGGLEGKCKSRQFPKCIHRRFHGEGEAKISQQHFANCYIDEFMSAEQ